MVAWVSKAWTDYERQLPVFYREALGRLLCLEHFRNLIETQSVEAGTTVYTDHAPSTYVGSLSNKGRLSTWKIHETSDLIATVQTLYKAGEHLGPPHGMADPLSRLPRGETLQRLQLPALLKILLDNLPPQARELHNMRVNAEKDTTVAARIVQRWRAPTNPISVVRGSAGKPDFLIVAPYADKVTHQIADHIRRDQPFAALVPVDLLHEIDRDKDGKIDERVRSKRESMATIVITSVNLVWLISYPGIQLEGNCKVLFSKEGQRQADDEAEPSVVDERLVLESIDEIMATSFALTRAQARSKEAEPEDSQTAPPDTTDSTADHAATESMPACTRTTCSSTLDPLSFKSAPKPDPIHKWVGRQDGSKIPIWNTLVKDAPGKPKGLLHVKDAVGNLRIIVPVEQRERLVKQEHQVLLHVGGRRVLRALQRQ